MPLTPGKQETLRLFFALWPDAATRQALSPLLQRVKGRRVKPENLHITMAFLGPQPAALVPQLLELGQAIALPAQVLLIDQLGYFRRNRIAWAGMSQPAKGLEQAHRALVQGLKDAGIAFDHETRFRPHLTLAREADEPAAEPFDPVAWQPDGLRLVASKTGPAGAQYTVLG